MNKQIKVGDKVLVAITDGKERFGFKTEILKCIANKYETKNNYLVNYNNGWEWYGQQAWIITEEDIIEVLS